MATVPARLLLPIWREAMRRLARRSRGHLLSDLEAFAPMLGALGTPQVSSDVIMVITQIRRRWP
jgi:hypothetical protein